MNLQLSLSPRFKDNCLSHSIPVPLVFWSGKWVERRIGRSEEIEFDYIGKGIELPKEAKKTSITQKG